MNREVEGEMTCNSKRIRGEKTDHEAGDDAVETAALEVQGLAAAADACVCHARSDNRSRFKAWTETKSKIGVPNHRPNAPFSPVHRARKFSAVLGTTSSNSCGAASQRGWVGFEFQAVVWAHRRTWPS